MKKRHKLFHAFLINLIVANQFLAIGIPSLKNQVYAETLESDSTGAVAYYPLNDLSKYSDSINTDEALPNGSDVTFNNNYVSLIKKDNPNNGHIAGDVPTSAKVTGEGIGFTFDAKLEGKQSRDSNTKDRAIFIYGGKEKGYTEDSISIRPYWNKNTGKSAVVVRQTNADAIVAEFKLPATDVWHNYALSLDGGTDGKLRLWVDGAKVVEVAANGIGADEIGNKSIRFNRWGSSVSSNLDTHYRDVRIYNKTLTDGDVATIAPQNADFFFDELVKQVNFTENQVINDDVNLIRGSDISWTSSNNTVLDAQTGEVKIPTTTISVDLTLKYKKFGKEYENVFKLKVAAKNTTSSFSGALGDANAVEWLDTQGKHIQSHGGQVQRIDELDLDLDGVNEGGYIWVGEDKTRNGNPIDGVRSYTSADLYNWTNQGTVLATHDKLPAKANPDNNNGILEDHEALEKLIEIGEMKQPTEAVTKEEITKARFFLAAYVSNPEGVTITDRYDMTSLKLAFKYLYSGYCIVERPKMIYNATTKKYILVFHADGPSDENVRKLIDTGTGGSRYSRASMGFATSDSPNGPFKLVNVQRMNYYEYSQGNSFGNGMARDMTVFVDDTDVNKDGIKDAYALYSSEENKYMYISLLNGDYAAPITQEMTDTLNISDGLTIQTFAGRVLPSTSMEAPAIFKYGGYYYMITSGTSGWDPNEGHSFRAKAIFGPWEDLGDPCDSTATDKTYFSQSTAIIPVDPENGKFIYMGDRWKKDALSTSSYVWLPITFTRDRKIKLEKKANWNLADLKSYNQGTDFINPKPVFDSPIEEEEAGVTVQYNGSAVQETLSDADKAIRIASQWNNSNSNHAEILHAPDYFKRTAFKVSIDANLKTLEENERTNRRALSIGNSNMNISIDPIKGTFSYGKNNATDIALTKKVTEGEQSNIVLYYEEDATEGFVTLYIDQEIAMDRQAIGFKLSQLDNLKAYIGRTFGTNYLQQGLYNNIIISQISNKFELKSLYNTHKDKAKGNYTDASWTTFAEALQTAKTVLGNGNASQEAVENAKTALQSAVDGLIEKESVDPTAINLDATGIKTLKKGKTLPVIVSFTPSNATSTVTWEVSNPAIVSVDENGQVKGLKVGTTKITAKTANGKLASFTLRVSN